MTRRMGRLAFAALLATLSASAVAAQIGVPMQRDQPRAPVPGGGSLAGTVVSAESPSTPLPRVTIKVSTVDGAAVATVYTDAHGQFLAPHLAAGRYLVVATRPAYVRAAYGAKHPDRPGTPVTLAEGQALTGLTIALAHGAVITGVVTDDGQPVPGVVVRVSQYRTVNGERTLMPVVDVGGPSSNMTDDRGTYRLFGLPAGEYVVSAAPRPVPGGDIRQMTPADIQSVRQVIQANAAAAQPRPPDPVTVTYATVYYPGTTVAASATPVQVAPGEERHAIDLALQLVRTAHVEGMVVAPPGVPPQSVQVLLVSAAGATGPPMIAFNRAIPGPDGRFSYSGLAPGDYTISARATAPGGNGANATVMSDGGGPVKALAPVAFAGGPIFWGQADVTVNGENVSGVSITLQPGLTLSGHVAVETQGAAPPDLSKAMVTVMPAGNGFMINMPRPIIDPSGRFTLAGLVPGRYRLSASLTTPGTSWSVKSATIKGKDVLDGAFEIAPTDEITDATVTFTNQTQDVSGRLQDASGRPATDFTIVLFPADHALWTSTRRVRTVRPATDGRFAIADIPAGDYRLAAVVDVAPGEATDPAFLADLTPASIAVTLHEGEKKLQDVRLAGGG